METKIDRIRSNWTINDQCGLNRINIDRIGLKWTVAEPLDDQGGPGAPPQIFEFFFFENILNNLIIFK